MGARISGVTVETLTTAQIRRLAHQAAVTGDAELTAACAEALRGDAAAREICAARIEADAAADVAAWEVDNPGWESRIDHTLTPAKVLARVRAAARGPIELQVPCGRAATEPEGN